MTAPTLVPQVLMVAAQAFLLYCLSRLLFVWVLRALANDGHGGGALVKLLRLPGNAVHELSHCIGYLVCGYRVKHLVLCAVDPAGRGRCVPGRPWSPLAVPWVATAVAAIMPLVMGTAVLYGLALYLEVPVGAGGLPEAASRPMAMWDSLRITLQSLDLRDWRTLAFLYAAFSIGAELAPSDVDLRRGLPSLAVLAGLLVALTWYLGGAHPESAAWEWLSTTLSSVMDATGSLLNFGLLAVGMVALPALVPALIWRAGRKLRAA